MSGEWPTAAVRSGAATGGGGDGGTANGDGGGEGVAKGRAVLAGKDHLT
jgi:hypothetical protein